MKSRRKQIELGLNRNGVKLCTCKSCSFDGRTLKVMIISPSPEVEAGGDYVESVIGDSNVVILDTCNCSLYRCHFVEFSCSNDGRFSQRRKQLWVYLLSLFPFLLPEDTSGSNSTSNKTPKRQRSHSSRRNVIAFQYGLIV